MKNIETNKKTYHKIVKQDLKLKVVKTDTIPEYSDIETKFLNTYIKKCKQKISFLTLVNKVATSLRQYSCKSIEDAKKANLIYDESIIYYCLPEMWMGLVAQLDKTEIKIKNSLIPDKPTHNEVLEYRQKLIKHRETFKKYKLNPLTIAGYLPSNIESIPDHLLAEYYIDEQIRSANRQTLNDEQINNYYSYFIKKNTIELNGLSEFLKILEIIKKDICETLRNKNKQLATPNILSRVVEGKTKDMSLLDLYNTKQNDIEDLIIILQSIAPHIYNNKLADYSREKLENYILDNSQEIITYIDGAKLTILEDRAFCAIRYLAVKAFDEGLVESPDKKVTVKPSDIYKLSGVPYTKEKGYHIEQKLVIKNTLTDLKGNLRKPIHIEYEQKHRDGKAILSTNFIKYLHWNDEKNQVLFEIDSMFFVNIPGQDSKDYWPDDVIGRVGYISTLDQGFKNERQYKLHKYLASCLRKKISFNVMTLLEQSGLINDYKLGNKKSALTKLQSYLDGFYNYGTLIKNKPIKIPSKSDIEGKYELERI